MSIKKYLLPFIATVLAIYIGPSVRTLLLIGTYYVLALLIYGVIDIIRNSRYVDNKRRIKQVKKLTDNIISMPSELIKLQNWLQNEGFILKIKDTGSLYLQSKTTKIDYYHSFDIKVFISSLQKENEEYLVYEDDEVLKAKIQDYLTFLTERNKKPTYNDYIVINRNYSIDSFSFLSICIRLQGYVFLIVILINVSEENYANIYKLATFITYFLIETYEKRT